MNYTYNLVPIKIGGEKVIHLGRCVETGLVVVIKFLKKPYSTEQKRH